MPVDYLHIFILSNEFRIEYLIDFQFPKNEAHRIINFKNFKNRCSFVVRWRGIASAWFAYVSYRKCQSGGVYSLRLGSGRTFELLEIIYFSYEERLYGIIRKKMERLYTKI